MGMICGLVELGKDQIDKLLADPENVFDYIDELEENEEVGGVDLDKVWHGIHFLLTGSAWEGEEPLCYLVNGGEWITSGQLTVGVATTYATTGTFTVTVKSSPARSAMRRRISSSTRAASVRALSSTSAGSGPCPPRRRPARSGASRPDPWHHGQGR